MTSTSSRFFTVTAVLVALLISYCSVSGFKLVNQYEFLTNSIPALKVPKFCNGLDCPVYDVLVNDEEAHFNVREYKGYRWASTTVKLASEEDYNQATRTGFMRLFGYISGNNKQNEKIEMAAPVLTKVIPGQGPACETSFEIKFFTPFKLQSGSGSNPPQPLDNSQIVIEDLDSLKVAVTSFGGYVWSFNTVKNKLIETKNTADRHNIKVDTTKPFYVAQYDAPFKIFNRHNEVWLPVA